MGSSLSNTVKQIQPVNGFSWLVPLIRPGRETMVYRSYRLWNNIMETCLSLISKTAVLPQQYDPYELYKSYWLWTMVLLSVVQLVNCIHNYSHTNDIQFPTARLVNHCFTTCMSTVQLKPLFQDQYKSYKSFKNGDAFIQVVSVRLYWTTLMVKSTHDRSEWSGLKP